MGEMPDLIDIEAIISHSDLCLSGSLPVPMLWFELIGEHKGCEETNAFYAEEAVAIAKSLEVTFASDLVGKHVILRGFFWSNVFFSCGVSSQQGELIIDSDQRIAEMMEIQKLKQKAREGMKSS